MMFTVLSMIAEFEADLSRSRTCKDMAIAPAKGRLHGDRLKSSRKQKAHLVEPYFAHQHAVGAFEELFGVTRCNVQSAGEASRTTSVT